MSKMAACIFCKIIKGDIPSMKLFESDKTFAFLDINPLSYGHAVCPLPAHQAHHPQTPRRQTHRRARRVSLRGPLGHTTHRQSLGRGEL
ncbi:hypothetical protein BDZ85DRAFT_102350 [Elsinoe ampelina]|uniref:HIT domain-containing protein n=1 Tax=Elsinoe ampelina TaxID=302913 RepID=A0A6A6GG55_9PEZI|nr:hypothetical protein BDZ85DRAFT_102350 [Elsinoe ampelina]